jgi:hypothetical protein
LPFVVSTGIKTFLNHESHQSHESDLSAFSSSFVLLLVKILFSCANLSGWYPAKLLQGRTLITQNGRGDPTALWGQTVVMRARDLADQTMGAQEPQETRDPSGNATAFFQIAARLGIKMGHQIAIAKSLQDVLTPADDRQKVAIGFGPRMQGPEVPAFPTYGFADRSHQLLDREGTVQRGQGLQLTIIDALTNLGPALGIRHAFA